MKKIVGQLERERKPRRKIWKIRVENRQTQTNPRENSPLFLVRK
jgi:hypothetical protein